MVIELIPNKSETRHYKIFESCTAGKICAPIFWVVNTRCLKEGKRFLKLCFNISLNLLQLMPRFSSDLIFQLSRRNFLGISDIPEISDIPT